LLNEFLAKVATTVPQADAEIRGGSGRNDQIKRQILRVEISAYYES
jgi:hypothetical protein